jgi:hypothetical protein
MSRPSFRPRLELLEERSLPSLNPVTGSPFAAGAAPQAIVSADFNGDGVLDLATVNTQANTVSVLLGNVNPMTGKGDGTFQAAKTYAVGSAPVAIAVGKLDGQLDIVTANAGGDLSFLPGIGDGTFGAARSISLPTAPTGLSQTPLSVAIGDLNKDGKLDLVVTGQTAYTTSYISYYGGTFFNTTYQGQVNVLLGDGSGAFSASATQTLNSTTPESVQVADLGNGNPDVVTANPDLNSVGVLLGNGDGTLGTETDYGVGAGPSAVAVGDVNGDGTPDLATANANGNSVSVLLGNGGASPTFQAAKTTTVGTYAPSLALADFNNDGKMDVVTADNSSGQVSVLLSKGDGTLTLPITATAGTNPVAVAAGDFNGDSLPDVAVANSGSADISVLLNDGTWPPVDAPSLSINSVSVTEGNSGTTNAVFTVTLSAKSTQTITVHYSTADGTATVADNDYLATSGTLTFMPGQTTATIPVPVVGDRIAESNETFTLTLSEPTNAFLSLGSSTGTGTIIDDEPRISISNVTKNEGNKGTTAFVFTVTLSAPYDAPVTVHYATSNGTATVANGDYIATSGTLTFAPGQTTATITVKVNGNRQVEPNEYFYVNLSSPSSDALITDPYGIGTIVNDDFRSGGKKHN